MSTEVYLSTLGSSLWCRRCISYWLLRGEENHSPLFSVSQHLWLLIQIKLVSLDWKPSRLFLVARELLKTQVDWFWVQSLAVPPWRFLLKSRDHWVMEKFHPSEELFCKFPCTWWQTYLLQRLIFGWRVTPPTPLYSPLSLSVPFAYRWGMIVLNVCGGWGMLLLPLSTHRDNSAFHYCNHWIRHSATEQYQCHSKRHIFIILT